MRIVTGVICVGGLLLFLCGGVIAAWGAMAAMASLSPVNLWVWAGAFALMTTGILLFLGGVVIKSLGTVKNDVRLGGVIEVSYLVSILSESLGIEPYMEGRSLLDWSWDPPLPGTDLHGHSLWRVHMFQHQGRFHLSVSWLGFLSPEGYCCGIAGTLEGDRFVLGDWANVRAGKSGPTADWEWVRRTWGDAGRSILEGGCSLQELLVLLSCLPGVVRS